MTVARDPCFWRRFSLAVHLDEEAKGSTEKNESSIFSDSWLTQQKQKRRRSILCGFLILATVAIGIGGVVVVLWWFSEHNWLQGNS